MPSALNRVTVVIVEMLFARIAEYDPDESDAVTVEVPLAFWNVSS